MDIKHEVIYVIVDEKMTVHRKMNQKDLGTLLQDENIQLISVNENRTTYCRKKKKKG